MKLTSSIVASEFVLSSRAIPFPVAHHRPRHANVASRASERLLGTPGPVRRDRATLVRPVLAIRSPVADEEPADTYPRAFALERASRASRLPRCAATPVPPIFTLAYSIDASGMGIGRSTLEIGDAIVAQSDRGERWRWHGACRVHFSIRLDWRRCEK